MSAVLTKSGLAVLRKIFAAGTRVLRSDRSGAPGWQVYLLALVSTAATLALRLALDGPLGGNLTLVIFTVPIMLSAYLGGLRAGLLATAFSLLASSYYLLPPIHHFGVAGAAEGWQLFFIALAGVTISGLNEMLHRARRRAEDATREHRRVELSLQEEREFLRALIENVGDAIVACDAHGVITLFNRVTREFHGLPGDPIPADQWAEHFDLYLPDGTTRMPREQIPLFRALHEGAVRDAEMVIAPKGGTVRRVLSSGQAFYDATGAKAGAVVAMHDITDQRRAEESLRVQSHILDHIGQAVIATELGGSISYANRFAGKLYGWAPGEMIGRNILDVTVPQISREEAARIMAQLQRGESWSGEFGVRRRDGTEFPAWVTNTQLRDSSGAVVGIVGISEDITERKRSEEALRASERRLEKALRDNQQVLDKSLDVVCTIDAGGRFTSVSAACQKLFGYSPAEMTGRPFLEFVLEDDRASTSVAAAQLPAGRELHDYENRYVRKDGRVVTISWSATWSDADQSIFCVGRDCTERKQAEEAHAGRLVAERANAAKSQFLSRMSHELRTPMNAILGFAQVLESEDGLNAEQLDSVNQILGGGAHLLKLINEVLDITSIEAGRMTISSEAVELPELLEETTSLLRPLSSEFGVRVEVLPQKGALSHVQADRQRLKQVLLNLVGNAIKYNRPDGRVMISFETPVISPGLTRISVTDTGAGLDAAKLSGLFHPFERLGAERTPIEGTGLGLVLSKHMVEHMGGVLGVESVVGQGSTFWIELPAAELPPVPEESVSETALLAVPAFSVARKVVLSIEDNPSNVRLITRILERRPVQFLNAETGASGLRMAREFRPDLILLDLHLPDSDGHLVLERLAADPRTAAIPVMVMTADALSGKREQLLAAGADAFLAKPVDVRAFLQAVDRLLNQAGGESGAAREQS